MTADAITRVSNYRLDGDAVEFGLLYLLLVAVSLFEIVAADWMYEPVTSAISIPMAGELLAGSILGVAGLVVVPLLFVRLHGVAIPTGLPDHGTATAVALAVVAPLAILAAMAGVAHVLLQSTVSGVTQGWYGSEVSLAFLFQMAILPALLLGIGYGLLFNGAIQGSIRERFDAHTAVVVATVIAGAYLWFDPSLRLRPFALVNFLVLTGLIVLLGYAAALVVGLRDDRDTLREQLTGPQTVVFVLAGVIVASIAANVAMGATELTELLSNLAWVLVVAVAAVSYERTRSIWVPMLSIALFQLGIGLTQYAEFLYGFASAP